MRVCVIGGTGHISTSIVRVLLAQGHEVSCFNRGRREFPKTACLPEIAICQPSAQGQLPLFSRLTLWIAEL